MYYWRDHADGTLYRYDYEDALFELWAFPNYSNYDSNYAAMQLKLNRRIDAFMQSAHKLHLSGRY